MNESLQIGDTIAIQVDTDNYTIHRVLLFQPGTRIGDRIHCEIFPNIASPSDIKSFDNLPFDNDNADFCVILEPSYLTEGQKLFNHPIQQGERGSLLHNFRMTNPIFYAELENIDTDTIDHEAIRKFARAGWLADTGKNKQALELLNESITLEPEFAEAYEARGDVYSTLRQYENAITDYETALKLNAELQGSVYGLGWALGKSGKADQARSILQEALEKWPDSPFLEMCMDTLPTPPVKRYILLISALLIVNLPIAAIFPFFHDNSTFFNSEQPPEHPLWLISMVYYGALALLLTTVFTILGPILQIEKRLCIPTRYQGFLMLAFIITWGAGIILVLIGKLLDIL